MSPLAPTKRWIAGVGLLACSSMFFELSPSSSASIIAKSDHLTMSNQRVVAVAHRGPERLLRDDLRQDDMVLGPRRPRGAQRDEPRVVGGKNVARPLKYAFSTSSSSRSPPA